MTLSRVAAIARADAAIRLRRLSTVVVFLLLSACPYWWIPDPSTGRALIQIGGARALYNSAALGMATASLGTIFVGLFGFYVISNAVRRDIDTRCGLLLASSPMRDSEYIAGKFAGNLLFLTLFMAGFMATSMAMQVVRGEAALAPLIFIKQYLLMVPPSLVFVAAAAVIFECTPFLSGRFGDVVYFFVWLGSLGVVATSIEKGVNSTVAKAFDFSSFGFLLQQIRRHLNTTSLSIGSSTFDAAKPPFVFGGLTLDADWIVPRLMSIAIPIAALTIARIGFHRFDPARIRSGGRSKSGWIARINRLLKPLVRIATAPFSRPVGPVSADALMTFTSAPWVFAVWIGITIAAFANPASLPVAFAATAVLVADVATRDGRAGTVSLVRSAPHLRERFVWWKLASTAIVAFVVMAVPIARAPAPLAAAVATIFIACVATAIGVVSGNPKAFTVLFLTFWYIVVNDKGTAALNFGGVHGNPPLAITAAYAGIAIGAAVAAHAFYTMRLRRGE